jgi:peptidoglycan hydrolase-like protein with peptidoglycan-binding domain
VRARAGVMRRISVAAVMVASFGAALSQPASAQPSSTTAAPVTTCATLAPGATGPAVKTIQKAIGVSADGQFGPLTQKAVKKWQKANKVTVSGVIDAATWAAFPAAISEKACGQKVAGGGVTATCAALTSGATGIAVDVLQKALGLTVDGQFGPATLAAVKGVQATAKVRVSGITRPKTWKALHLIRTPACTRVTTTTGPPQPADEKAQQKIRAQVVTLAAELAAQPGTTKNKIALQAMAFAKKQIGKPYVWGGTGPKGYDCSGLQMTSYLHAGLNIPRVSAAQYAGAGTQVPLNEARQGDLLFYASDVTKPATVYHVVMYVGNGQILDSPQTGEDVQIQQMWTTDLLPIAIRPVAALTLPLKPGATGATVTQLQQDLNRHGAKLTVDGGYGPGTETAVKAWQARHKLTANGVVHVPTWLTLG